MGCGQSMTEESKRSRQIGRALRKEFSMDAAIVKILLLGAGESGKSTIVKQMKLLHVVDQRSTPGFSDEERADARAAIYSNVVESMMSLLEAMDAFGLTMTSNKMEEDKAKVVDFYRTKPARTRPGPVTVNAIKSLWGNSTVQLCYQRRNEFQLNDSAAYFLSDVERVCDKEFTPTDQDVLHTRVTTTGIVKIEFEFERHTFHMFDVGGQRSERKKWIHCFDNVTAVLFVVSISEFDQVLFEDCETNRMLESLQLFRSLVNSIHFKAISFIVFFNKKDLFEEKLKTKSLKIAFPDYTGDNSFKDASDFLIERYLSQSEAPNRSRSLYPHLTTATDTQLVERVFTNVSQIILNHILKDIGLN